MRERGAQWRPIPRWEIHRTRFSYSDEEAKVIEGAAAVAEMVKGEGATSSRHLAQLVVRKARSSLYALDLIISRLVSSSASHIAAELTQGELFTLEGVVAEQLGLFTERDPGAPLADNLGHSSKLALAADAAKRLLLELENIPLDSKWDCFRSLVAGVFADGKRTVVVFAGFRETAQYIAELGDAEGLPIHALHESMAIEKRWKTLQEVRNQGGLVVFTDALLEGITVDSVAGAVHYDLPSGREVLIQRIGCVERLRGHGQVVPHHFLLDDRFATEPELDRLLQGWIEME
jgi:hypothetical protein